MIISHSPTETFECGRHLAEKLGAGSVIALMGDLGAGKTCLVKGIARGLGIAKEVTSPTFTLIHEYRGGRLPLYHVDLYRLDTVAAAISIGIEEYLPGEGVTVIEWAEKIESLLPPGTMRLRLTQVADTTRRIEVV
ncbi:MAG: tRNA (adenosine(37)-N6)-threonylcarbamoyltransferase complex ATPase subunit type 1 TsaE [Verrucomicrobia bacterium]|nr:tRNA (adenosine(37)-N6)-threonylcarbamoyltransferase complex ATPase subunit type 1 TsaE [Verrucomicrobiota bacterium]